MNHQNMRVLVASERPSTRSFLKRLVETDGNAIIVAEAENGARALNLARTLRPDVAIIDSYLPSVVGIDNIPLSRAGGLDLAQSVSEEIPNTRVILLNKFDGVSLAGEDWNAGTSSLLCRESKDMCVPFRLSELSDQVVAPGSLIFANVEQRHDEKSMFNGKMAFEGKSGAVFSVLTVLALFVSTIGIYILVFGLLVSVFGLLGKLAKKVFR